MTKFVVHAVHPVDLASGRVAAPGSVVDADPQAAHDAALIEDGVLVQAAPKPRRQPANAKKEDGE